MKKLIKVGAAGRFAPHHPRKALCGGVLLKTDKDYRCPFCSKRRRVQRRELVPSADWKGPASPFGKDLLVELEAFAPKPAHFTYDFFCKGCGRPVRLIYEYGERFMGGPWFSYLLEIVEEEP